MAKPSRIYKPKQLPVWTLVLLVSDAAMIVTGFWFAYYLRFVSQILPLKQPTSYAVLFHATTVFKFIPLWLLIFYVYKLYDWRYLWRVSGESARVVNAVTLSIFTVMIGAFLGKDTALSRAWLLLAWFFCIVLVVAGRSLIRYVIYWFRKQGIHTTRLLVVGANEEARTIAEQIFRFPGLGLELLGFVEDQQPKGKEVIAGSKVVGKVSELPQLISKDRVDLLIIVSSAFSHKKMFEIIQGLEDVEVEIQMSAGLYEMVTSRVAVRDIGGVPLLCISKIRLKGFNLLMKTVFDYLLAALSLVLLSPLMLLFALLVKMTSPGPVLYMQPRVGRDGRVFSMCKYRTMIEKAEEGTGPVWAKPQDPRCTPLGRFLRRFSLDELPQLLNVLKGEMSLVGPRPERPVFVENFHNSVPRYMARHRIKAGMTGWAQVNGLRGNTSLEERVKYDNFYIENWSLLLDIEILIRTLFRVFSEENAY